jgi:hypothetical protein
MDCYDYNGLTVEQTMRPIRSEYVANLALDQLRVIPSWQKPSICVRKPVKHATLVARIVNAFFRSFK